MTKKTYGVSGLLEWQCIIHTGKARIRIPFTGGAITAYGVTPAEYTTSNPHIQAVIEDSEHFRTGRISLLKQQQLGTPPTAKNTDSACHGASAFHAEEVKTIKVATFEDAVAYLKEHHGIAARKVSNEAALNKAAAQLGITFAIG